MRPLVDERVDGDDSKTGESGFKVGDHVKWNSEAGRVSGIIIRKIMSDTKFKGYVHHATKNEPQFFIKSDKTDHIAIHKSQTLKRIDSPQRRKIRSEGARS